MYPLTVRLSHRETKTYFTARVMWYFYPQKALHPQKIARILILRFDGKRPSARRKKKYPFIERSVVEKKNERSRNL